MAKVCSKCKETKPFTDYYTNKSNKRDGHANYCKVCAKKHAAEWNRNNSERHMKNLKKYHHNCSAVYKISNEQNECLYVGQTIAFNRRKNIHIMYTRNPKEKSGQMSLYVNLNKEQPITIEIIEKCSVDALTQREHYYINLLKPKYNG